MSEVNPALDWTIAEVLACIPQATVVFTRLRMACAGCVMAPFETLAEMAAAYHLEPQAILAQLRQAGLEPQQFDANWHDEGERDGKL